MKIESEVEALATVRQDGMALHCVPEALRTSTVCLAAVRQDGLALQWVPDGLKLPEICVEAVCAAVSCPNV